MVAYAFVLIPQTTSKATEVPKYPILTVDDLLPKLSNTKIFPVWMFTKGSKGFRTLFWMRVLHFDDHGHSSRAIRFCYTPKHAEA